MTDDDAQRQNLKVRSGLEGTKDNWTHAVTFNNASTHCLTMQQRTADVDLTINESAAQR